MRTEIEKQLKFFEHELQRVKLVYNDSGFDITSAPAVLCRQYRNAIKEQINLLNDELFYIDDRNRQ